jgi:hypothetical protein
MQDGIRTLLTLGEKQFAEAIGRLRDREGIDFWYVDDKCKWPDEPIQLGLEREIKGDVGDRTGIEFIGRGWFGGERFPRRQIIEALNGLGDINEDAAARRKRLQEVCGIDGLVRFLSLREEIDKTSIENAMKVLSSDEEMEAFTKAFTKCGDERVVKVLADIFKLSLGSDFYIPQLLQWKYRFNFIQKQINMDKYIMSDYTSPGSSVLDYHDRKPSEEQFDVNPMFRKEVLAGMPQDFSPEQKALYVYAKLSKLLKFNGRFLFRDNKSVNEDFSGAFNKERIERIQKGSEILCYDFSRLFEKFANEIEGVTGVVIEQDKLHWKCGFYTDDVSVGLEGINSTASGDGSFTPDTLKAKQGLALGGIKIISDRKGLVNAALEKIYPLIYGNRKLSVYDLMEKLKTIPQNESGGQIDRLALLKSYLQALKQNDIEGFDATTALIDAKRQGFFGDGLKAEYIGERTVIDGQNTMSCNLIIVDDKTKQVMILEPNRMQIKLVSPQAVAERLRNNELAYRDNLRTINMGDIKNDI